MKELRGTRIVVLGLGRSGKAAVRFCAQAGASVVAMDRQDASAFSSEMSSWREMGVELAFGGHDAVALQQSDLIVVSPGIAPELPELCEARRLGIPVVGELELALQQVQRPIIAVTGTNGKTTTTALIGSLLEASGVRACVAGNIGTPLLDLLAEANASEWIVLEVSSFQIDTAPSLRAQIAIWLNVTEDHLDRHGSYEAYVDSKAQLFRRMSSTAYGIYNAADASVTQAVASSPCVPIPFAGPRGHGAACDAPKMRVPRAWSSGGMLHVQRAEEDVQDFDLTRVQLQGVHQQENMLAALSACLLAGASPKSLQEGLERFQGLPHRMEFVREYEGVRYIDDSKGTNVGATVRALEGFCEPVILIAGGRPKGTDFAPLVGAAQSRVKLVILLGEAAPSMQAVFAPNITTVTVPSMEEAVRIAAAGADPGDVVLLSPACASFDMFRDYVERGEVFQRAVREL